jgi:hypothetical protein
MKLPRPRILSSFAALGTLTFAFAACESTGGAGSSPQPTTGSHFSPASQGTIVTDHTSGSSGQNGLAAEGGGMPEGIGRYAGEYYYIRNGGATRLVQRQRFAQGWSFDRQRRIVAADGSIVHLENHEMVTFGGDRLPIPSDVVLP